MRRFRRLHRELDDLIVDGASGPAFPVRDLVPGGDVAGLRLAGEVLAHPGDPGSWNSRAPSVRSTPTPLVKSATKCSRVDLGTQPSHGTVVNEGAELGSWATESTSDVAGGRSAGEGFSSERDHLIRVVAVRADGGQVGEDRGSATERLALGQRLLRRVGCSPHTFNRAFEDER